MMFAYIDVALGSMALQAAAGLVFAGIVMGRRILLYPLSWFSSAEVADEFSGEQA